MFERFTTEARSVVVDAQSQARRLGHPRIGTEHLLLALLAAQGGPAEVLGRHGITIVAVEAGLAEERTALDADRRALADLGIDLDRIRAAAESTFGRGALQRARDRRGFRRVLPLGGDRWLGRTNHLPFTRRARKVLELALREALRLQHRDIGAEHIALGLLREGNGLACDILAGRGVPVDEVRAQLAQGAARAR